MDLVDLGHMALVDLRPARNPRLHHMAVAVEGDFARVPQREDLGLRPRADPAHLPFQDIENLRQLVDARRAQPFAYPRDALVVMVGDRRQPLVLLVASHRPHRAEFVDGDPLAGMPDALLAEQRRPLAFGADGDCACRHQRKRERKQRQREQEVGEPLQMEPAARRQQRSEAVLRQLLELDPAGQRFRQLLDLVHDPPGERGIGEEGLPFVGQVGAEVGDDRMAAARVVQPRPREGEPVDPVNTLQPLDRAERHHREPAPDPPFGI